MFTRQLGLFPNEKKSKPSNLHSISVKHSSLKHELVTLRHRFDELTVSHDAAKLRLTDLESMLANRDRACAELKASLERHELNQKDADEDLEKRYQVSRGFW